jgi:cytochrome c biogenesis protein CcmG/thiol:disulfide interchange protein DsbE
MLALPAFAIKLKDEKERKKAPQFELKDRDGKVVRLSDFAGKVVLLDFWATWCGPCKSTIPWFNELTAQYGPQGFAVIGVSMDGDGWPVVAPFMDKMEMKYTVLLGDQRVKYLYGDVEQLPLAFFIDRNGKVAGIHLGPPSRKDLEKAIKALLAAPGDLSAQR